MLWELNTPLLLAKLPFWFVLMTSFSMFKPWTYFFGQEELVSRSMANMTANTSVFTDLNFTFALYVILRKRDL